MLEPEELLQLLKAQVEHQSVHRDYDRVCRLRKFYKQILTGEDCDELLQQFVRRESSELFTQRLQFTQNIFKPVSESVRSPFFKVGRTPHVSKVLEYNENASDTSKQELEQVLSRFNGDDSVDDYFETRFTDLSFLDPNAFVIVEFDSFDPRHEKAKPRPLEISCIEAVNFEYQNNELKWLLIKQEHKYAIKDGTANGNQYTLYGGQYIGRCSQIEERTPLPADAFKTEDGRCFTVEIFQPKASMVQAFRIGYKPDLSTEGRTFVSPLDVAEPFYRKMIKTVSEFDITMGLHAHPQKVQYIPRCDGFDRNPCINGKDRNGGTCQGCGGTGLKKIPTSAQEAILLKLPEETENLLDLSKIVHYNSPPIDLVKFQNEYILQLKEEVYRSVFNSDVFKKDQVAETATFIKNQLQNVYDTLFPFSKQFSKNWIKTVQLCAEFTDLAKGLSVLHKFPKDMKMKSMEDLIDDLKAANESNAPTYIRHEINNDIVELIYIDRPTELKKFRVKQNLFPFKGKSEQEIAAIIQGDDTTRFNKVLWTNFDQIIDELELENASNQIDFYSLSFDKQKEQIKSAVLALIAEIEKDKPRAVGIREFLN